MRFFAAALLGSKLAVALVSTAVARDAPRAARTPEMARYKQLVFWTLSARLHAVYVRSNIRGAVTSLMRIVVDSSGRVTSVSFPTPFASSSFNAMALAAVPPAFPPPPLPKGARTLTMSVPLRFYPHGAGDRQPR